MHNQFFAADKKEHSFLIPHNDEDIAFSWQERLYSALNIALYSAQHIETIANVDRLFMIDVCISNSLYAAWCLKNMVKMEEYTEQQFIRICEKKILLLLYICTQMDQKGLETEKFIFLKNVFEDMYQGISCLIYPDAYYLALLQY